MDIKKYIIGLMLSFSVVAGEYNVYVQEVKDGDTFSIVWPGLPPELSNISIRMKGLDTPEIHTRCQLEKDKGFIAKDYLKQMIENKNVIISNCEWDKFGGRWNCNAYFEGIDITKHLIERGFAIPYYGEKKTFNWCQ